MGPSRLEPPILYVQVIISAKSQLLREGYLRLASEQFDLSEASINNLFIHLTNNAIQKNHAKYEKYELGNQLSFDDLQSYFDQKGHEIDVRK